MNSKVTMVIRILIGIGMVAFGLNKFLGFMPMPEWSGTAADLMRIWGESGFMSLIGVIEILGGLTLLTNKFVPLGLTFLIAVLFNAAVFHLMHDIGGIAPSSVLLILCLVLVYAYKDRFKSLLSA